MHHFHSNQFTNIEQTQYYAHFFACGVIVRDRYKQRCLNQIFNELHLLFIIGFKKYAENMLLIRYSIL